MSEDDNQAVTRDEELILDLLDAGGEKGSAPRLGQSESFRESVELLGLLPRALDEATPSPKVRDRILGAVAEGQARRSKAATGSPAPGLRGRSHPWLMPMAAGVALAMVAVTGWLVVQVRAQQLLIAELSRDLAQARSVASALALSRHELDQAHARLALAAERGTEFCALSPPEGSPAPDARGLVMMHEAREDWYLRVEGLAPCPVGRRYVLWFVTRNGKVPGPSFDSEPGQPVEVTITKRPKKIDAIMITLESEPDPEAPSTAPLLFGNERTRLL